MNPDMTSPSYLAMVGQQARARRLEQERQAALHRKAVARRRKAKRGGKR